MTTFYLRCWAQRVLIDSKDYAVVANTLEEAVTLLRGAQEEADTIGAVGVAGVRPLGTHQNHDVTDLDPREVIDAETGISQIDERGVAIRDLVGMPFEREAIGPPL